MIYNLQTSANPQNLAQAKRLDCDQYQGWKLRAKRDILQLSVAHWTWNWPWRGFPNMDLFDGSNKLSKGLFFNNIYYIIYNLL